MSTDKDIIEIISKIAVLDERSKNFENRLDGIEREIDEKLKNIETKIDKQSEETNSKLDKISEKLESFSFAEERRKASYKTILGFGSITLVLSSLFSWIVDKWQLILTTFFK